MNTNSVAANSPYLANQEKLIASIKNHFPQHDLQMDKLNEPILWAKDPKDYFKMIQLLKNTKDFNLNYLSDLTAYDNVDQKDGEKRFVIVVQLYSLDLFTRLRIKLNVSETENVPTLFKVHPAANWLEREVYDMYGVIFDHHPNLRRIMMDERFTGHPLRKEYPMKQREAFSDNIRIHLGSHDLPTKEHKNE